MNGEASPSLPTLVPDDDLLRVLRNKAFKIHLAYPYPEEEKENATNEERLKYHEAVGKFIAGKMTNLDGFELLDEANRYEIVFLAGWKLN